MEKNLEASEALKKFKKLVEDIRTCMFITNTHTHDNHTRPMSTVDVEDNGSLWFFTDIRSIKVEEVSQDRSVHLVYAHPGKSSYLDVWGSATVSTDKALVKEKWNPIIKAWFPNGADDPNIALLQVKPSDVHYWDSETGKMMSMIRIAIKAVTGAKLPEGVEGKLSV